MVDYTTGTGSGGIMLIRDQGYNVEFHVQSGQSATFGNGLPWNGYVNGVNVGGTFNYSSGRPWVHIATYGVGGNQSIKFGLGKTNTQGLGGPTDLWVTINRATVPAAPTPVGIDTVGHTQFRYMFSGNSDGGSPIREWQIGYGYDPNNAQYLAPSSGTIMVGQFTVGATIYIWSRGRNDVGWGPWSSRMSVVLLQGGRIKVNGGWGFAIPYVKYEGIWRGAEPYDKKNDAWRKVVYAG